MMDSDQQPELLLGKSTPLVEAYAPELLYPIPRSEARSVLGWERELPFHGVDVWHAYEISWLDARGCPVAKVGRFAIPADSPFMVESKSFKLYLNSLNNHRFETEQLATDTIVKDVSAVAGKTASLQLFAPDDPSLAGQVLPGHCLDNLAVTVPDGEPDAALLDTRGRDGEEEFWYTHLLRSLCPVTGQPDWATLWIHITGTTIEPRSLLAYLLAYRQHQEFHEQCVERVFRDILQASTPVSLTVQAFYTRRGGLDINPFRSTDTEASPIPRLNRQ